MRKETTYEDMLKKANSDFLKKAAKKISKIVGNKGDVSVGGVCVPMLTYDGVDSRDIFLRFTFAIRLEDHSSVAVDFWVEGFSGKHQDSFNYLTTDFKSSHITAIFENYFR